MHILKIKHYLFESVIIVYVKTGTYSHVYCRLKGDRQLKKIIQRL